MGRRYYIVVSRRRNPISWVVLAVIASGGAIISGQQPNGEREPYVAALLPGEQAWVITLPAAPAAGGAMDRERVYIPLQDIAKVIEGERIVTPNSASVTALDRHTGAVQWVADIGSTVPPVAVGDRVFVAAPSEIHALAAATGQRQWSVALGGPVRGAMLVRGNMLLALTEPNQLVALRIDTREIAWRAPIAEGRVLMDADARAAYLTTPDSRVICVRLADGSIAWQRTLAGTLSAPAVGRDRVVIGSDTAWLWALDPESGDEEWKWPRRIFGGDIMGAAIDDDFVYVASLDNVLRALNRGNGNLRWRRDIGTRPVYPPRAFFGTVAVIGLAPRVSTFLATAGTPVATWAPPAPTDAELEGAPLIDEHLVPFGVAMVVIMRDGRVVGVRPTAMTFPEPAAAPLKFMPGRPLRRETLPGETEPATVPPVPSR